MQEQQAEVLCLMRLAKGANMFGSLADCRLRSAAQREWMRQVFSLPWMSL